jgi:hypothetical protein
VETLSSNSIEMVTIHSVQIVTLGVRSRPIEFAIPGARHGPICHLRKLQYKVAYQG